MYTIIRRNIISKDSGVSPAIAVILIIALTVLFAAITGIALLSNSNINSAAPISGITITEKNGVVTFTHFSGETLKAGEYKIILDSRTISGNSDFGPGNVLNYEAENINHAAIVSTTKGNEAVIAEKYFGGSGVLVKKVNVEVIGFTSSSDLSEKGEYIDGTGKYEVIFGTESNIGIIIKLSGEYVGDVKELKKVNVGSLETKKLESFENPYCYSIPNTKGGAKYLVSGEIIFNDGTFQKFNTENVYIPGESELTFKVDTYAKYITGVFSTSASNKYVGHGLTVEITGGSRKDDAIPIIETLTGIKVILDGEIVTRDKKKINTLESGINLIRDDKIITDNTKSYYHIENEAEYRGPLDVKEYIISIKFKGGETKEYTFKSEDESLKGIINFHIPAWSPLHEDNWRIDPINPFDVNIEPYISANKDQHGVKVTVSNGNFPDIKYGGGGKIFPVNIKVTLTPPDNNKEIRLVCYNDIPSIDNGEYLFIIDSDEYIYGIDDAKVKAVFTMTDSLSDCNIKSKSFETENNHVDIPGLEKTIDSPIDVKVEGYMKYLVTNIEGDTGHGIKITVTKGPHIDSTASYYLGVTLNNNTINYPLNGNSNFFLKYDTDFNLNGKNSNGGCYNFNNYNNYYLKVIEKGELTGGDGKKGISYLYIGLVGYGYNDYAIDNADVKLDLYKYADKKLTFIKNIYEGTVDIPPRHPQK